MRRLLLILGLLLCATSCFAQISGSMGNVSPVLPQVWIASTLNSTNFPDLFSSPVLKTVCASGCDYTTLCAASGTTCNAGSAIAHISTDAPTCGEIIEVTAGFVESVGDSNQDNFPVTCPTGKHVWIRTHNYASLPAQGTRVQTSDKANMFEIAKSCSTSTCKFDSGFYVLDGASGLVISGMDIELSGANIGNGFRVGTGGTTSYPSRVWLDRSYIDTTYSTIVERGFQLNGNDVSITDSVVDHIAVSHAGGCAPYSNEGQGLVMWNSSGPLKFVNNYIGGSEGEGVIFGGATPVDLHVNPSDVEFRENEVDKDPAETLASSAKNLFECKQCIRVLVDGNIMKHSYNNSATCNGQQEGSSIDSNMAVNSTSNVWSVVQDYTITNNDFQDIGKPFVLQGTSVDSELHGWPTTQRELLANNVWRGLSIGNDPFAPLDQQAAGSGATISSGSETIPVSNTTGYSVGTTNLVVVWGYSSADKNFNCYLCSITAVSANTSITIKTDAPNATATSSGQVAPVFTALSQYGINVAAGQQYYTPPSDALPVTTSTAASTTSGSSTVTLTNFCPSGVCFLSGQAVTVVGFSGADTCYNGTYTTTAVNSGARTITYPTGCSNGSASTNATKISMVAVTSTAASTDASGNSTLTLSVMCPGGTANPSPGSCYMIGEDLNVAGFTGADTCYNTAQTKFNFYPVVQITGINTAASTITYHSSCSAGTASSNATAVTAAIPIPSPLYVTFLQDSFLGASCPTSYLGSATPEYCPLQSNGGWGANGERLTYFENQYGCGGDKIPYLSFVNLMVIVDSSSSNPVGNVAGSSCGQTANNWVSNGAVPNFTVSGNVAVTPSGTGFANWPSGTSLTGTTENPAGLPVAFTNAALCLAGDPALNSGDPSLTDCAITGTYASVGANIPAIIAAQTRGNDTTAFGPRTAF